VPRLFGAAALLVALVISGCSAGNPPASTAALTAPPGGVLVRISADRLEFDTSQLTVPAGKPILIAFENKESAPHNVAVYTDSTLAQPISIGEVFSGPDTKAQQLGPLAAGSYFFRCDLHPNMKGTLVAQ
jgi:plastocyanin